LGIRFNYLKTRGMEPDGWGSQGNIFGLEREQRVAVLLFAPLEPCKDPNE